MDRRAAVVIALPMLAVALMGPARGSSAYIPWDAPPASVYFEDTRQLRNAQRLALMLSRSRKVNDAEIFTAAGRAFTAGFSSVLDAKIKKFIGYVAQFPKAPLPIKQLSFLFSVINVELAAFTTANELLKFRRATTPDRITSFYAEPLNAQKIYENRQAIAWRIKVGGVHRLSYWVTAYVPGTANLPPVITPAGIADKMVASIRLPIEVEVVERLRTHLREWIREAVAVGFQRGAAVLRDKSVDAFGYHYTDEWLRTDQPYWNFASQYVGPIDIGEIRTIVIGQHDPAVLRVDAPALYYTVTGRQKGETAFLSQFTEPFKTITLGGDVQITRRMHFQVVDDEQPKPRPDVAPPMPVLIGPPRAPALPPPRLGDLPPIPPPPSPPEPPPPPPAPPAPAPPPAPGFAFCKLLPNGMWDDPERCLPK